MLVHVEFMETDLCHFKIVFTVFKSYFELDTPLPTCD